MTRRSCSPRPGWSSSRSCTRPPGAWNTPAPRRCRSASASPTWSRSATPPGIAPSSRCSAISVSAITSSGRPSPGRGSSARSTSRWTPSGSGRRSISMMTKPRRSGSTRSACRPNGSFASARRTTSGARPAQAAPAARAARSTTTWGRPSAPRRPARATSSIATRSSGTSFFRSSSRTNRGTRGRWRSAASTPAWGSSD